MKRAGGTEGEARHSQWAESILPHAGRDVERRNFPFRKHAGHRSWTRVGAAWATALDGMALTNVQSPTYHRKMPQKPITEPSLATVACFALLLGLAGCEDATKKPVQARVPALSPAQVAATAAPELGALPLRNLASQPIVSLQAPVPLSLIHI